MDEQRTTMPYLLESIRAHHARARQIAMAVHAVRMHAGQLMHDLASGRASAEECAAAAARWEQQLAAAADLDREPMSEAVLEALRAARGQFESRSESAHHAAERAYAVQARSVHEIPALIASRMLILLRVGVAPVLVGPMLLGPDDPDALWGSSDSCFGDDRRHGNWAPVREGEVRAVPQAVLDQAEAIQARGKAPFPPVEAMATIVDGPPSAVDVADAVGLLLGSNALECDLADDGEIVLRCSLDARLLQGLATEFDGAISDRLAVARESALGLNQHAALASDDRKWTQVVLCSEAGIGEELFRELRDLADLPRSERGQQGRRYGCDDVLKLIEAAKRHGTAKAVGAAESWNQQIRADAK